MASGDKRSHEAAISSMAKLNICGEQYNRIEKYLVSIRQRAMRKANEKRNKRRGGIGVISVAASMK